MSLVGLGDKSSHLYQCSESSHDQNNAVNYKEHSNDPDDTSLF